MNAKERLIEFFEGLKIKDLKKVENATQITWKSKNNCQIIPVMIPQVRSYEIISEKEIMGGVADFEVVINDKIKCFPRVIREVSPYKPDPDGENGEWGVSPSSIANTLV